MEAVSDLNKLLKNMKPELKEGRYFIATVDESQLMSLSMYLEYVICICREEEGLTIVFQEDVHEEIDAMSGEKVVGPFALITLSVHSDLMAVGFIAKITEALAKEKISVNAFSAYHHDHLLVPYEKRDDAMKVLESFQED